MIKAAQSPYEGKHSHTQHYCSKYQNSLQDLKLDITEVDSDVWKFCYARMYRGKKQNWTLLAEYVVRSRSTVS
jgi:hypothetical protein